MEYIVFAAGMLAAFLLGAYIRKPFAVIKKQTEAENKPLKEDKEESKIKDKIDEEFMKLMNFTGRTKEGE